ncbi:A/G-specific adenine glycosylase [soil metagenome]
MTGPDTVASRLIAWWRISGRKTLPWQEDPSPYRVWVSEIMLQQTQVAAVLPYFRAFMTRFPDLDALAQAPLDEVLHRWSGLGYYARARNLHVAARIVRDRFGGKLPEDLPSLMELPGIGRSTAGAIVALAHGQCAAILDGNARRVLARCFAVAGHPGETVTARRLWKLSESLVPDADVTAYTQALMDLGATVCTRGRPRCDACPLEAVCTAHAAGCETDYPSPRPRRRRPVRRTRVVLAVDGEGAVLLERRAAQGIWGGLWALPEIGDDGDASAWCATRFGSAPDAVEEWPPVRVVFTHFELDIRPALVRVAAAPAQVLEPDRWVWYNTTTPATLGLPAPVARLIARIPTMSPSCPAP